MKSKFLLILLSLVLVFSLCSCGATSGDKSGLEDFEVVLEWYPNSIHSCVYAAIDQGYFEDEGLNVIVQFPAGTSDGITMPAAGKADIGMYYLVDTLEAIANEDIPVVSVGSIVQNTLNIVISLKDKNIESPADLQGKTIGYSGNVLSEAQIRSCLKNAGLSLDDVTLIDVGWDLMPAMTTGKVDATIGCNINLEVPHLEEEGFDVNYFFPTDYGVPATYDLILLANKEVAQNEPEKIEKFLRAVQKGYEYVKVNPEETVDMMMNNQDEANFPLSRSVELKSLEILLPLMEKENSPFLSQDMSIWQKNIDWLYENGLIKKKVEANDVVVDILNINH